MPIGLTSSTRQQCTGGRRIYSVRMPQNFQCIKHAHVSHQNCPSPFQDAIHRGLGCFSCPLGLKHSFLRWYTTARDSLQWNVIYSCVPTNMVLYPTEKWCNVVEKLLCFVFNLASTWLAKGPLEEYNRKYGSLPHDVIQHQKPTAVSAVSLKMWWTQTHNVCKTVWLSEALLVYGEMTWTLLADSLDELRKCQKSAFLLSRPPRSAGQ
jgi:hypothetical protein